MDKHIPDDRSIERLTTDDYSKSFQTNFLKKREDASATRGLLSVNFDVDMYYSLQGKIISTSTKMEVIFLEEQIQPRNRPTFFRNAVEFELKGRLNPYEILHQTMKMTSGLASSWWTILQWGQNGPGERNSAKGESPKTGSDLRSSNHVSRRKSKG